MEKKIDDILKVIDDAVTKFQGKIPGIQELVFNELQPLIKDLEIRDGKLLNNLANLKRIGAIKNKLQRVIVSPEYKSAVKDFVGSYEDLTKLNVEYFRQFDPKFKAVNTLPIIKDNAIESAVNGLVGEGLSAGVVQPIREIFRQNITTGGTYAAFNEQLRRSIRGNENEAGILERHTRVITTDAINEYNAQYHEAIAQDLNFNWGRYVGSLLTTSREFCVFLTEKEWVHKSELPTVLKGEIDGQRCKINKKTDLPYGLKEGTTPDNFKIRRGGHNCGHQFFYVPDNAVPLNIRQAFNLKTAPPAADPVKPADPVEIPKPKPAEVFVPVKNVKEGKERVLTILGGRYPLKLGSVTMARELNIDGFNRRLAEINKLTTDYDLSGMINPNKEIQVLFKSTARAYGYLSHIQGTFGKDVVAINFGSKTDGGRSRRFNPDDRLQREKSRVDDDNLEIATTTHEFAHFMTTQRQAAAPGAPAHVVDFWLDMGKLKAAYEKEIFAGYKDPVLLNNVSLGKYANTNPNEFFAEAFTEYRLSSNPSKYAKSVGALVNKYFKKQNK